MQEAADGGQAARMEQTAAVRRAPRDGRAGGRGWRRADVRGRSGWRPRDGRGCARTSWRGRAPRTGGEEEDEPAEEAKAAGSAMGRACCSPPASRSMTGGGGGGHDGADERRATAQLDSPRWAADRGRRRRIHEGEGLLLPSRERIDDDSTTAGGEWSGGCYCCCDDSTKKTEMGLVIEGDAAPRSKIDAPRGSAVATEGGGRFENLELG